MHKPALILLTVSIGLAACAPEVGSDGWCDDMEEQPAGEWSINEATDYAKHCLIDSRED